MKYFKFAPLSLAVAALLAAAPVATSQAASQGDLEIYKGGLPLGELGSNSGEQGLPSGNAVLLMLDMSSIDGKASLDEFKKRKEKMIAAITYLMKSESEGGLSNDTLVGLGAYPSTTIANKNLSGDGVTAGIFVPVGRLGPPESELTPDAWKKSHRKKILDYVNQLGSTPTLSPMAPAYAEAGAYMMGNTTSALSKDISDGEVLSRALRQKGGTQGASGTWEYCPPESRVLKTYIQSGSSTYRLECDEANWIAVSGANLAPYTWTTGFFDNWVANENSPPTTKEIESINGKTTYDLMWGAARPFGILKGNNWSPKHFDWREYDFAYDTFTRQNPTPATPAGEEQTYRYYYDKSLQPDTTLEPDFKYRALRKRYFVLTQTINGFEYKGSREYWEYCPKDKAELVNYIYSSYRYMCNEADWKPLYTEEQMTSQGFERNGAWLLGNRPKGIGLKQGKWHYRRDALLNPYNSWVYYYDVLHSKGDNPALPRTLSSGFSSSGVRNSPPEVRKFQKYNYDAPNYRICKPNGEIVDGTNPYQYNPANRATKDITVVQNAAIFFLTAGMPSSSVLRPLNEMNKSLNLEVNSNGTPTEDVKKNGVVASKSDASSGAKYACDGNEFTKDPLNGHWGCMGAYSNRLNSANNPTTRAIKTGVFLISPENPTINPDSCEVQTITTNLLNIERSTLMGSYRNACLLGSSEYGDGGFDLTNTDTTAESVSEFAGAIKERIEALNDETIQFGMIPSGPIEVPANSLRPGELMGYGYLPLAAPNPGSGKSQWVGNLRKYKASNKGYVGQNNIGPFSGRTDTGAAAAILAGMTKDYWSSNAVRSIDQAGGAFEKIQVANKGESESARKVYVSSFTVDSGSATDGKLLKRVSPKLNTATSINNVKVFSGSTATLDSKDVLLQRLLLNYMGYKIKDYDPTSKDDTAIAELETKILNSADSTKPNKVMGAVVHSTPVSFVTKATIDETTGKYTPQKEYILFGAMDNALHVVDNATGEEVLSYFPKEVLTEKGQYKGITPEKTGTSDDNTPSFGVDGPWAVYTSYIAKDGDIEADKVFAYGGARLGAQAYYGLNLKDIDKPRQLFTITNSDSGVFSRLGYTWAKPVVTKIRWQGQPKLVVVLSGGYDREYDKTDEQRLTTTTSTGTSTSYTDKETLGNAIYIVDAETGKPLIVASNKGASVGDTSANNADGKMVSKDTAAGPIPVLNSNMKYSIPGGVKVLDRDADELTDHIYFADLNGQVFRMDIDNKASKPAVTTTPTKAATNPNVRVQRIADLNWKTNAPGPRLYEAPTVTIQTSPKGQRFATVSVASGDRSNPLSKNMSNHVDAVYTLYDKDVAQVGLLNDEYSLADTITATKPTKTLGVQSLNGVAVSYSPNGVISSTSSSAYDTYDGWMAPFTEYGDALTDANPAVRKDSIKAMGPLAAIANKLYVSAYNPDDGLINTQNACLPEVLGTTEIHQYCLPYGVCVATGGSNNQYQRFRAGKGIMIPSFGTDFDGSTENAMSRSLIGQNTQTNVFSELKSSAPDAKASFSFKGLLNPLMWFDMQSKKSGE